MQTVLPFFLEIPLLAPLDEEEDPEAREAGKPVGYSRVAAGEGHAGLPWGGRGNHEKVLRAPTLLARARRTLGALAS